jgi:predicted naringenin-chalcone synthase
MSNLTKQLVGIGLLGICATAAAMGAAKQYTAGSPQDEATAKAILTELLAIDTTYEKGTVAAVEALRTRFLAA